MKYRVKNIQPPATPRLSVTIILTTVAGFLAALAAIVGNLASTTLPDALRLYVPYSWVTLGVILLLGIIVTVWQVWYASGSSTNTPVPITVQMNSPLSTSASQSTTPATTTSSSPSSTQPASSIPTPVPAVSAAPASGPSLYHTCVISYSTDDERFVKKLYADLKAQGVPCRLADQDGKLGDKLRAEIYQAIRQLDKLLLVLSKNAIESLWVEEEVDVALDREHQQPGTFLLFPLRLDETVFTTEKYWAITVRQRRIGDFRQWEQDAEYQQALQRVLRDLHV